MLVDAFDRLHAGLDRRPTSEYVASLVLEVLAGRLTGAEQRVLGRAANSRPARYSSMPDDFERPVAAVHKVRMLLKVFGVELSDDNVTRMAADPWILSGQLAFMAGFVGWMPGTDLTVARRRARGERAVMGLDISRRQYNRRCRQLRRTAVQAARLQRQVLLRQLVLVGRSGLAYSITVEQMRADPDAAAFVAYWTAQRNRRRAFSLEGRDNPYDTIAHMLFTRCVRRGADTNWWMIGCVYPVPEVLERLGEVQRGELMGRYFSFMRLAAVQLDELARQWPAGADRTSMRVQRGMDSSTWNTVAQAYNQARAGWLNCVAAAGALRLLNAVCPGKAMRLLAGDQQDWHERAGSAGDAQQQVWAQLPAPWQVLDGLVPCTARTVELACHKAGVDPRATGWTAAAGHGPVGDWSPTAELVHGVEVGDPLWAGMLRRAGVFSGKPAQAVAQPAGERVR